MQLALQVSMQLQVDMQHQVGMKLALQVGS